MSMVDVEYTDIFSVAPFLVEEIFELQILRTVKYQWENSLQNLRDTLLSSTYHLTG